MLISEEVEVKLHPSNVKYYEDLYYEIPRVKINGKYVVRKGTTIIVKVKDLQKSSNIMVEYKCDYCGTRKQIPYCDYTRKENTLNKDFCIDCIGDYKSELNKYQWEEKFNSELKTCSKCKREFPKTLDYFYKSTSRPDGLTCQCKECASNKKIFGIQKDNKQNKKEKKENNKVNNDLYLENDGYKICKKCERKLPADIDHFYKRNNTKDGFVNNCKECEGKSFTDKLIHIPKEGYKFCIKCNRELPIDIKYFPPDKMCKNGLRNVCRECGQDGHFMEDGYIPKQWWSKEEEEFFISVYPNYTCEELVEKYYPDMTTKQLWDKAYNLGVSYKNENTVKRANEQRSNKMSGENSPFYGVPKSSETIDKFKISIKRYYKENNGWWLGKKRSEKQRNMLSERMKGNWAGDKNPRYVNPLKGKDNPNWRGGITQLYFELRSEIKEWQQNSMKSCNYKCVLTNGEFDNVHHLYPFKDIVNEVFEILRLDFRNKVNDYLEEEFNKIKTILIELHDYHGYGVCLCKDLHKLFHDTYGYLNNTPDQFNEFAKRYYNFEFDELLNDKYKYCNVLKLVI